MSAADSLSLKTGPGFALRAAHFIAALLGLTAILLTPAGWNWKLGALSALVLMTYFIHAASLGKCHSGTIRLLLDGSAHIRCEDGSRALLLLKENAWVARWLCVLSLIEPNGGRLYHCVVCASENTPGEYRRLVKFLKMRGSKTDLQKATW